MCAQVSAAGRASDAHPVSCQRREPVILEVVVAICPLPRRPRRKPPATFSRDHRDPGGHRGTTPGHQASPPLRGVGGSAPATGHPRLCRVRLRGLLEGHPGLRPHRRHWRLSRCCPRRPSLKHHATGVRRGLRGSTSAAPTRIRLTRAQARLPLPCVEQERCLKAGEILIVAWFSRRLTLVCRAPPPNERQKSWPAGARLPL